MDNLANYVESQKEKFFLVDLSSSDCTDMSNCAEPHTGTQTELTESRNKVGEKPIKQ